MTTSVRPGSQMERLLFEIKKVIVGQDALVERMFAALLARGHCLIEGVPGVAKTLAVETMAKVVGAEFQRIQFTPDLVPADIVGTRIYRQSSESFDVELGPVYTNFVLADEINRAPAKVQSAMLEVMAEGRISIGGQTHVLPKPFLVMATQNPIEQEGVYPLPEAQRDRFLFKINVGYPTAEELVTILDRTTSDVKPDVRAVARAQDILRLQDLVKQVPIAEHVKQYAARLVMASHPDSPEAPRSSREYVRFGASPRGAIALVMAAKVNALIDGRYNVAFDDIRRVAHPALRHRLILNFEADAEGVNADAVIDQIVISVRPEEAETAVR
jgi:MoxR-like ATPase